MTSPETTRRSDASTTAPRRRPTPPRRRRPIAVAVSAARRRRRVVVARLYASLLLSQCDAGIFVGQLTPEITSTIRTIYSLCHSPFCKPFVENGSLVVLDKGEGHLRDSGRSSVVDRPDGGRRRTKTWTWRSPRWTMTFQAHSWQMGPTWLGPDDRVKQPTK